MFKTALVFLALCALCQGLQPKDLYISDDLYMFDFDGRSKAISSKQLVTDGHAIVSFDNDFTDIFGKDCSFSHYSNDFFQANHTEQWKLLKSAKQAMGKAMSESKKLLQVSFEGKNVNVVKDNGYPKPEVKTFRDYTVTILSKGHCAVTSPKFTDNLDIMVINQNSVTRLYADYVMWLTEAHNCGNTDILDHVKKVQALVEECKQN